MPETSSTPTPPWVLLDTIEVDKNERVQCQCKGCGKGIYAAIHMIQLPSGEIQCWGNRCYAREAGLAGFPRMEPLYSGFNGRKLTEEEREWLRTNRDRLIAKFKAEHEEKLRRQEEERQAEESRIAQASIRPIRSFLAAAPVLAQPPAPLPLIRRSSLPTVKPPPIDYNQTQSREPMHDPRYQQIREQKVQDWLRKGIDLTTVSQYHSLIENCLRDYRRDRY